MISSHYRVVIVGGGPGGLCAAKCLLDEHLTDFIVLESSASIGGVWNPTTGHVYPTMHTNLSKYKCEFSDVPHADDLQEFPSAREMYDYLKRYASTCGLDKYIRCGTRVIGMKERAEGGYVLTLRGDSDSVVITCDNVILACGVFHSPKYPKSSVVVGKTMRQWHAHDATAFLDSLSAVTPD
eukprot:PhF_6_TR25785/c0_g1_i1/m.36366